MDTGATLILVAAGAILTSTLIATVSRLEQRIRVSLKTANRLPRRIALALLAAIRRTPAPAAPQMSKRVATYTLLACLAVVPVLLTACGKGRGGY